jgi:O-antigen/teichoic acid export membrane protein
VSATDGAAGGTTRSIARSSVLLLAARIVGNVGFFAAVLVLARSLGPTGRGTIAFLTVLALVLAHVVTLGVTSATIVFASERPQARPTLFTNLVLFTAAAGAAAAVAVSALLLVLEGLRPAGLEDAVLLLLIPGTVAAVLVEAGYAFLIGCSRFGRQAAITATAPWLYACVLIVLTLGPGLDVGSAAVAWVATTWGWALLLAAASLHGTGIGRGSRRLLAESVRFGVRAWVGSLSLFLTARVDQILLGIIATEAALGIYATAVNAAEVLLYVPAAAATALLPAIARTEAAQRPARALAAFRMLALVTGSALVVATAVGPPLIPLVFGEAFAPSVVPFMLLLPGALGFAAFQVFSAALLASGSPGLSSVGASVALVVGIALDLALIPPYGASGAAVAATVAFLAGGGAATLAYRRRANFSWGAVMPGRKDVRSLLGYATRLRSRWAGPR